MTSLRGFLRHLVKLVNPVHSSVVVGGDEGEEKVAQVLRELLAQETVPASATVRERVRGQWGEERGGLPEVFAPLLELSSYDGLQEEVRV